MNGYTNATTMSRTAHDADYFSLSFFTERTYIERRIATLKSDLSKHKIDIAAPCTSSFSSDCWLLDNLTPLNRILRRAALELCQLQPRFVVVRSTGFRISICSEEDASLDASFITYWLLTHHICIDTLELDHAFCYRHPLDVKLALTSALNLQKLKFCWQSIDGAHYIMEGLRNSRYAILDLDLSMLSIDDKGADYLSDTLTRNASIQSFAVSCSHLSAYSYGKLLGTLVSFRSLTQLSLHSARGCGSKALANFLKHNRSVLKLSLNKFHSITVDDYALILDSLHDNTCVEELNLFRCYIRDEGARVLAAVLKKRGSALHRLKLRECGIHESGAIELADSLKSNTSLEYLSLRANNLDNRGTVAIADMLKTNKVLKKLDISHCSISSHGVSLLVEALLVNTSLEYVKIGRVPVSRSTEWLPLHLAEGRVLERLRMTWQSQGLYELAAVIRGSETIEAVHIDSPNLLTVEAYSELFSALRWNRSIKTLILNMGCLRNVSVQALTTLSEVFSENETLKKVKITQDSMTNPMAVAYAGLAHSKSIAHLEVRDEFWQARNAKAFCNAIRCNKSLVSLVIRSQSLVKRAKLLDLFSKSVYANPTLTSVQVWDLEGATRSTFKIQEACRRNILSLHQASRFLLRTTMNRSSAAAFNEAKKDVLMHHLTETMNIEQNEAKTMVCAAERFLRANYFKLAGIVKDKIECIAQTKETTMRLDSLNEDCLCNIASFLCISDVLEDE
ncbi:uncharacterized protein LOC135399345 [Ornithodoros turicata]|uniref:uncharacterized protein LOC135399345 n=1 Tax=Ornithodoros turicata TaxID=34597 RepID=UPI003138DF9B